jgi:hypothetical protein
MSSRNTVIIQSSEIGVEVAAGLAAPEQRA